MNVGTRLVIRMGVCALVLTSAVWSAGAAEGSDDEGAVAVVTAAPVAVAVAPGDGVEVPANDGAVEVEEALPVPLDAVPVEVAQAGGAVTVPASPAVMMNVYRPAVRYRPAGLFRSRWQRQPQKQTTLLVEDPACCGRYAEVSVCLPCCCEGEARVCVRPGVLGRCWVDHQFACGYCVSVLFRARGDVVVVYR